MILSYLVSRVGVLLSGGCHHQQEKYSIDMAIGQGKNRIADTTAPIASCIAATVKEMEKVLTG
jgi:hypothetical protein